MNDIKFASAQTKSELILQTCAFINHAREIRKILDDDDDDDCSSGTDHLKKDNGEKQREFIQQVETTVQHNGDNRFHCGEGRTYDTRSGKANSFI